MSDAKPLGGGGKKVRVTVLSPEVELLDKQVDFAALPGEAGEVGILPRHAAMVARLGTGEMRLRSGAETERHFISGGYLQIRDNHLVVLTEEAVDGTKLKPAKLDEEQAAAEALPAGSVAEVAARRHAIEVVALKRKIHAASA